jgi:hypothetical protein
MVEELTESTKETIKSAARKLTGSGDGNFKRRWRSSTATAMRVELKWCLAGDGMR